MKWKGIDNLDIQEIRKIDRVLSFLSVLGLMSSSDESDSLNNYMSDNFCPDCESDLKYCECHSHYYHRYDAYDRWKDSRLEDDDGN